MIELWQSVVLGVGLLFCGVCMVWAVALNEGRKRGANRRDLAERHRIRADAQEALSRHLVRPDVDIDVQPKGRS